MSEIPFMPLKVSDFIADTMEMDSSQTGAYIMLLMAQWKWGGASLPDDPVKLQRIARCNRNWPKVWDAISVHFERDADGWFNAKGRQIITDVRTKSTANSHNGALGGAAKARNLKDKALANATKSQPHSLYQPEPEPEPEQYGGGGDTREAGKTDREMILTAIGVDPVSGITGPSGRQLGTQADMAEVARWLDLPGITIPLILTAVRDVMARKRDGPPSSFRFFSKAIQRLSGEMTRPPLDPIHINGGKHDRTRFDQTINAIADGLSAGTIDTGASSRDPFAKRPGRDTEAG